MSDRYPTTGRDQPHATTPENHLTPLHEQHFSDLDRQVARTRPTDAPDLRSQARRDVDELHALIEKNCLKAFGKVQSMDAVAQPSDRAAFLLQQAQAAEARFIQAAGTPGTPPATAEELRQACAAAYEAWLGELRAVLPSAAARRARELQADDLRTGRGSRSGFRTGSQR